MPLMAVPEQETPLPGMGRGVAVPARQVAKREPREVRCTPEGQNAADIVGEWADWYFDGTGIHVPQSLISRMGKQIRGLIITGYDSKTIKFALAIWTMQEQENPMLSPVALDRICWRYARDSSSQARAWRDTVKRQITEFTRAEGVSTGAPQTKKQAREQSTREALARWEQEP